MSDRLHTHLEHGVVAGCPGCEQTRVDLARSRRARQPQPELARA